VFSGYVEREPDPQRQAAALLALGLDPTAVDPRLESVGSNPAAIPAAVQGGLGELRIRLERRCVVVGVPGLAMSPVSAERSSSEGSKMKRANWTHMNVFLSMCTMSEPTRRRVTPGP